MLYLCIFPLLWCCVCCSLSALIKIRNVFSGNVDNITYCEAIIGAGKILMVNCCFSLVPSHREAEVFFLCWIVVLFPPRQGPSHHEVEVFFPWWIVVLLSTACSGRSRTLSPAKMAVAGLIPGVVVLGGPAQYQSNFGHFSNDFFLIFCCCNIYI